MPTTAATRPKPPRIGTVLRGLVGLVLELEGRRGGEIGVVLANDEVLREFNRRWRGIDRATDVISFNYDEDQPDRATRSITGDIVISMDRVRSQARRYRVSPGQELARLVIHGTLHLCGHDHTRAAERRTMRERERVAVRAATRNIRSLEQVLKT